MTLRFFFFLFRSPANESSEAWPMRFGPGFFRLVNLVDLVGGRRVALTVCQQVCHGVCSRSRNWNWNWCWNWSWSQPLSTDPVQPGPGPFDSIPSPVRLD